MHFNFLIQEDEEDALTLSETGDLANVVLRQGRAIGTLGHEEEMRKLRRQLIPKKVGDNSFRRCSLLIELMTSCHMSHDLCDIGLI